MLKSILSTIGNTPLVEILSPNPLVKIFAKLEFFNPTGSIKDRIALYIIEQAFQKGLISSDSHIYEGSSGNTGASVAMVCAAKGLNCTIYVPEKASDEKKATIQSLGARLVIKPTEAIEGSPDDYGVAAGIAANEDPKGYFLDQYNNPLNSDCHYYTTGKELWEQMEGNIDYFITTASTGGTITGISRCLKEKNPEVKTLLADPIGSVYSAFFKKDPDYLLTRHPYLLEGAGKGKVVDAIDFDYIDEVINFNDQQAFETALNLSKNEGILAGGSCGGCAFSCYELAKRLNKPATIVTIFADTGLKYLSKYYNRDWLQDNIYNTKSRSF